MTKRELQAELRKVRKEVKRSNELLMRAAATVETMMALQDEQTERYMNRIKRRVLPLILNAATAFALTAAESNASSTAGAWKNLKPMTVPAVFAPAVVGPDNRIYVIGGCADYDSTNSLAVTRVYDPRTDLWTEGAPMPTPRTCPGAALGPDGKIYVMGLGL